MVQMRLEAVVAFRNRIQVCVGNRWRNGLEVGERDDSNSLRF